MSNIISKLDCYFIVARSLLGYHILGNLADLEEISPSLGRPHCTKLYEEAIAVNRKIFDNHHVYPYTYQGGYFYRAKKFKEAIEAWSNAADVIRL